VAKADSLKPRFIVSLTSIQELDDFVRNTRSQCIANVLQMFCKSDKSSQLDE
jgi:hypothetical protein